jgi:DNA-binding transcriptional ArsR family regulator/DNA-binding CsgD family transcriptional regulator
MSHLLRHGDLEGRYQSRSEAVMAIALAAANARWSLDQLRDALLDPRNEGGDWLRVRQRSRSGTRTERSDADRERRLERLWHKAQQRLRERPAVADRFSVRAELAEVRLAMESQPRRWGGQSGPSDYAVLCTLLEIAAQCLTMTPDASTRQIAERAGLAHQTVGAALRRLAANGGWLRLETPGSGTLAARWRILRPDPADGGGEVRRWDSARAHDAFAYRALGRVGARLYDLLAARSIGEHDLATISGLHRRTIRKHLHRLQEVGLARRSANGWCVGRASLDAVAVRCGSEETGERRRLRHQAEREAWVRYVGEFAARRGWRIERGLHPSGQLVLPGVLRRAA